mgnify:FL=1
MSTATLSAQEQENARINAENERLRKQRPASVASAWASATSH